MEANEIVKVSYIREGRTDCRTENLIHEKIYLIFVYVRNGKKNNGKSQRN